MANCSVCGAATSSVKSPSYPAPEFRKLAANGFRPPAEALEQFGQSRTQPGNVSPEQAWLEKVAQSEQEWILCPACVERATPFRPRLRTGRNWLPLIAGAGVLLGLALIVLAIVRAPKQKAISLRRLDVAEAYFTSVDLSPDDSLLAAGSADHSTTIWSTGQDGELHSVLEEHSERVNAVAFSPDGRLLASASNDRLILLWDPFSGELLNTLAGEGLAVTSLAFSPDGKSLASAHYDNTIRTWNLADPGASSSLAAFENAPICLAYTPDGKRMATGNLDGTISVLDSGSGAVLLSLAGHERAVNAISISADGRWLASAGQDGQLKLWDLQSGELLRSFDEPGAPLYAAAFSPDGKLLASGGEDGSIRLWQPETGALVNRLLGYEGETFPITGLVFSSDGSSLANSSTFDVKLWDMDNLPAPPAP
jgi:sugar lactone lactonase YvrE